MMPEPRRGTLVATMRRLELRMKRLEAALAAERVRHERQLESVRRAANRRLSTMMLDIASLRHHEARAVALERLLEEREPRTNPTRASSNGEDSRLPG